MWRDTDHLHINGFLTGRHRDGSDGDGDGDGSGDGGACVRLMACV